MSVRFVAEISSNHNADLARCLHFVDTAADIGCDGVKFQLFRLESLFAPEILARSKKHRMRKSWELPPHFLPHIAARARQRGLAFGCTPFDLRAVEEVTPVVDFLKIASYELTWSALLSACAATGLPVVMSTGMADLKETKTAVDVLRAAGCADLTLLHCVSRYPSPPCESNLACIETLRTACGCDAGWSDHSVSPGVIHRAVHAFSASMVEFHLDLEGAGVEYQGGHCWLPERMACVIKDVRDGLCADGDGVKRHAPSEDEERWWRADPEDGLRPFQRVRAGFSG